MKGLKVTSVHEGKKPFKCEICDVQFGVKHGLNEHVASVHEGKNHLNVLFVKLSLIKCLI